MTYEQDMDVREKSWYKDGVAAGMATQKAEDEKIIQESAAEIARLTDLIE